MALPPPLLTSRFHAGAAFLALSLAFPCAVRANDTNGAVVGSVRSVNGRPVAAGARVELDGPSRQRTVSPADGTFSIASITAGSYIVRVAARGFARRSASTIEVRTGETASVQFFLVPSDGDDTAPVTSMAGAALPPLGSDQSAIQTSRGVTPSALVDPSAGTQALARNLEPTNEPHGLLALDAGSFGQFGALVENTGTAGRLGYALALARDGAAGEVNQDVFDRKSGSPEFVGSGRRQSDSLGKLRYAFGGAGSGYVEMSVRDRSAFGDLSADLTSYAGTDRNGTINPALTSAGGLPIARALAGTSVATHDADYDLDVRLPLGRPDEAGATASSLLFRHSTSLVDESVSGPGAGTSPYLYDSRDLLDEETLQLDHRIGSGLLALQYDDRNESLVTHAPQPARKTSVDSVDVASGALARLPADTGTIGLSGVAPLPLGQTQRTLALRYGDEIAPGLQAFAGAYYSRLTPSGTYFGPRAGLAYAAGSLTTIRASAGTTYESPQLAGLVVPNPFPIGGANFVTVGTPGLDPDRATEYGIGIDRTIDRSRDPVVLSADVYRVDLRAPEGPGSGVYDGIALSAHRSFGPYATLRAAWAVRSQYLASEDGALADAALLGEQTAGAPLHEAHVVFDVAPPLGVIYGFEVDYEGLYNELNAPPFAVVEAHVGRRLRGLEIRLDGTNLTDVYDRRFTTPGGGMLYTRPSGIVAQSAFPLQGAAFTLSLVHRF
jgi:hypothetical protein